VPLENWDAEDAYVAGASRSEQNLGRKAELRDGRNGERETYGFVRSGVKIEVMQSPLRRGVSPHG